jgi:hypothetical protein
MGAGATVALGFARRVRSDYLPLSLVEKWDELP